MIACEFDTDALAKAFYEKVSEFSIPVDSITKWQNRRHWEMNSDGDNRPRSSITLRVRSEELLQRVSSVVTLVRWVWDIRKCVHIVIFPERIELLFYHHFDNTAYSVSCRGYSESVAIDYNDPKSVDHVLWLTKEKLGIPDDDCKPDDCPKFHLHV